MARADHPRTSQPRKRRKRRSSRAPPLTIAQILTWADAHYERTGHWPKHDSGPVKDVLGQTWEGVHVALQQGHRGLPSGSTLARLLGEYRGVRSNGTLPRLTEAAILHWADQHHERTGNWPTEYAGFIQAAPPETWAAINAALCAGGRGLPGGSSLALLLSRERGSRRQRALPNMTDEQILTWADAQFARAGRWPTREEGSIPDSGGETWMAVQVALHKGRRGLPGGSSLVQLLSERRGVHRVPPLSEREILRWAEAWRLRQGTWPTARSGSIPEAPRETWIAVDSALRYGNRGLPGGSSLSRLLRRHPRVN
jgi:hypothetical protein